MAKTKDLNQKNLELCKGCSECCRYIALEIDKPTDLSDADNIYWYLHHKNVGVYIGWDNKWYLEFLTPCEMLSPKGLCTIYDERPKICRDYSQKDCTKHNKGKAEKFYFKTANDLKKYFEKKKIKLKK